MLHLVCVVALILLGVSAASAQGPRSTGHRRGSGAVRAFAGRGGRRREHVRYDRLQGCGDLLLVPGRGAFQPDTGAGRVDLV